MAHGFPDHSKPLPPRPEPISNGGKKVNIKVDTSQEPKPPMILDGIVYKLVNKIMRDGNMTTHEFWSEIDEDHPVTIETRKIEALKHQGMLLQINKKK